MVKVGGDVPMVGKVAEPTSGAEPPSHEGRDHRESSDGDPEAQQDPVQPNRHVRPLGAEEVPQRDHAGRPDQPSGVDECRERNPGQPRGASQEGGHMPEPRDEGSEEDAQLAPADVPAPPGLQPCVVEMDEPSGAFYESRPQPSAEAVTDSHPRRAPERSGCDNRPDPPDTHAI